MLQRRNIKLDRANKSILLRALGNVYYAQKATGSDCTATGALVLRIHALPPKGGRLALDMDGISAGKECPQPAAHPAHRRGRLYRRRG